MKKKLLLLLFCIIFYHVKTDAQCSVNIGNDTYLCNGQSVSLGINLQYFKDSLVITYNATQGQTTLVGENKVYMHSGAELHTLGGWQYTKGNWGADDNMGLMKNIGTNLWRITIEPQSYFGYPADSTLNGVFMVFRNFDGTKIGKDNSGNDIWMDTKTNPPTNTFNGVSATWKKDAIFSILWSTGVHTPGISVNTPGTYSVIVTDTNNCVAKDTVHVYVSPTIHLGNDTTICSSSFPFNLHAGSGFNSYSWNGSAGNQNYSVNTAGTYRVSATTSNGCNSKDTISISSSSGIPHSQIFLGDDTVICGLGTILLDAGVVVSPLGDSIVIQYNAAQGQTQLIGATKVYMHSGAELHNQGGWQFVTGNWGLDNNLGRMKNIGTDLWQITIKPQSYFGYPADSALNGIFMTFRNEDGTKTGKDNSGNDIWMNTKVSPPTNSFAGVSAVWKGLGISSILWSDNSFNTTLMVSNSGIYTLKVTDNYGCATKDTINISTSGLPFVDIGADRTFCSGNSVLLNAGSGFSSYYWSTGNTAQSISTNTAGTYTVTVTNATGCSGFDVVTLTSENPPVASFSYVANGLTINFTSSSQNDAHFYWHFFGTSFIHDSTDASPSYTYTLAATYNVILVVSNSCGSDTATQTVSIVGIDESGENNFNFDVYPNPGKGNFTFVFSVESIINSLEIIVYDVLGEKVFSERTNLSEYSLDLTNFTRGVYFAEVKINGKRGYKKIIIN